MKKKNTENIYVVLTFEANIDCIVDNAVFSLAAVKWPMTFMI